MRSLKHFRLFFDLLWKAIFVVGDYLLVLEDIGLRDLVGIVSPCVLCVCGGLSFVIPLRPLLRHSRIVEACPFRILLLRGAGFLAVLTGLLHFFFFAFDLI